MYNENHKAADVYYSGRHDMDDGHEHDDSSSDVREHHSRHFRLLSHSPHHHQELIRVTDDHDDVHPVQ